METSKTEWHSAGSFVAERPSVDFIRAIADLLETDAEDILAEMGYVHDEAMEEASVEV